MTTPALQDVIARVPQVGEAMATTGATRAESSPATRSRSPGRDEHEAIFRSLGDLERKMAWHAGMWLRGRWQVPLHEPSAYAAIRREHARIEAGARPPFPKFTMEAYATELLSQPSQLAPARSEPSEPACVT